MRNRRGDDLGNDDSMKRFGRRAATVFGWAAILGCGDAPPNPPPAARGTVAESAAVGDVSSGLPATGTGGSAGTTAAVGTTGSAAPAGTEKAGTANGSKSTNIDPKAGAGNTPGSVPGATGQGAEVPSAPPATVAQAAAVLDLRTFPVPADAEEESERELGSVHYATAGTAEAVFKKVEDELIRRGWAVLPGKFASADNVSAGFAKEGFKLSASAYQVGPGKSGIQIIHHGNVPLGSLPTPPGAVLQYAFPASASYILKANAPETEAALEALLRKAGWEPYGTAGDSRFYRHHAVRLNARAVAAPAQEGKTVIQFSCELISAELPAFPGAIDLRFTDGPATLNFETKVPPAEVAEFYRKALEPLGWKATSENLNQDGNKHFMIFRNAGKDLLDLTVLKYEDTLRTKLLVQTAAEVAAEEKKFAAALERKRAEEARLKSAPKPKWAVAVPAGATDVKESKTEISFEVPGGQAKAVVEGWAKAWQAAGWKAQAVALDANAGAASFSKDGQSLTVNYVDVGIVPTKITVTGGSVELELVDDAKRDKK